MSTPILLTKKDGTQKVIHIKREQDALDLIKAAAEAEKLLPEVKRMCKMIEQMVTEAKLGKSDENT
jgi:hypothetical protein